MPLLLVTVLAAAAANAGRSPLELHREREAPTDLEVGGHLRGVPAGEVRFVRWRDLRALPARTLTLDGEFAKGEQRVTVVMLADVWKALPIAENAGADALLATCRDGYAAVYRTDFIASHRPFLILEIDGQGPEKWPPKGLRFNPGPYVISVSDLVAPAVATLLDAGHKRPWAVTRIDVANYTECNAPAFTGRWSRLSARAEEGRELWIHSCASCHRGPGPGMFGGTKSDRPFEVIAAHAAYNAPYFRRYVREPQAVISGAKMEAHPHYTDAQLDALIAFITAESGQ